MKVIGEASGEHKKNLYDYDLSGNRKYRIDENMDLYIEDMYLQYDTVAGEAADDSALSIDGYILER